MDTDFFATDYTELLGLRTMAIFCHEYTNYTPQGAKP